MKFSPGDKAIFNHATDKECEDNGSVVEVLYHMASGFYQQNFPDQTLYRIKGSDGSFGIVFEEELTSAESA